MQSEPRWPAALAVAAALLLYVTLPNKLTVGPAWVLPILEFALLVPLLTITPHRRHDEGRRTRLASLALIAIVNVANVGSLVLLIRYLLQGGKANGQELIFSSIQIWLTNVLVFGLWFWELDRGGPGRRTHNTIAQSDFLFPQISVPAVAPPHWTPRFLDYLYVSFTNATAFSPTDTMPLTPWAKTLMAVQSAASLLTVVLVAARAVNILS